MTLRNSEKIWALSYQKSKTKQPFRSWECREVSIHTVKLKTETRLTWTGSQNLRRCVFLRTLPQLSFCYLRGPLQTKNIALFLFFCIFCLGSQTFLTTWSQSWKNMPLIWKSKWQREPECWQKKRKKRMLYFTACYHGKLLQFNRVSILLRK